jgi:hypothetical protein
MNMADIEQVRAALEEIGKLVDLIDCSNSNNLLLLPLFLAQQKRAAATLARMEPSGALAKRPVAWRVKDYADGWIIFQDEETADYEAQRTGAVMQGLYVRDGTLP